MTASLRPESDALVGASRAVAAGMLAARATGFLRTLVLAAALGLGSRLFDAYNAANTMPNVLYDLLLGGVLSSIAVPVVVRAALRGRKASAELSARMIAFVTITLGGAVIATTLAAPLLVNLYAVRFNPAERDTAVVLIRFFMPQILFFGLGAVIGAIANANGHFRLPAWAPVANNLVVIAVAGIYVALGGGDSVAAMTPWRLLMLGLGTTFGIVLQTLLLIPLLRRCGVTWRSAWSRRSLPSGATVARLVPRVGWIVVYVIASQVLYLVVSRMATAAGPGALGVMSNSYAIFQVPYTIVAVSVMTAIMPELSSHGARGNHARMTVDLSLSLRVVECLLVPVVVLFLVLGPSMSILLFAHGDSSTDAVRLTGRVLMVFGVALVPFTVFQVLTRSFYAMEDTRTPALVNVLTNAVAILTCAISALGLHGTSRDLGLACGYCTGYTVGALVLASLLQRRLGRVDGHRILQTHVRVAVAGALAAVIGLAARHLAERTVGHSTIALLGSATAVTVTIVLAFGLLARAMHVTELHTIWRQLLPGRA